jgi:hypothetical protein
MEQVTCAVCGQVFKHKGAMTTHLNIRHVGIRYSHLFRTGEHVSQATEFKHGRHASPTTEWKAGQISGDKHPKWKGGRVDSGDGYVLLYKPGHHRITHSNYVYEHIVVWEEVHGCRLPDGYVIHHLNGIKNDNRPDNLLALERYKHSPSLTVKEVQRRLQEVEGELMRLKGGDVKNGSNFPRGE